MAIAQLMRAQLAQCDAVAKIAEHLLATPVWELAARAAVREVLGRVCARKRWSMHKGILCWLPLGIFCFSNMMAMATDATPAEQCPASFEAAKVIAVAGIVPFALLSSRGSLSHNCRIVAFYAVPRHRSGGAGLFARQWVAELGAVPRTTYADGRRCAALPPLLRLLTATQPAAPRETSGPLEFIVLDGATYRFWYSAPRLNSQKNPSADDIEFGGDNEPSLAELSSTVGRALESCWSRRLPLGF